MAGSALYDYGLSAPRGRYNPNPHIAYLGAPVDRSGAASASIAGTIYRNVWLGAPAAAGIARQRPLGSAAVAWRETWGIPHHTSV